MRYCQYYDVVIYVTFSVHTFHWHCSFLLSTNEIIDCELCLMNSLYRSLLMSHLFLINNSKLHTWSKPISSSVMTWATKGMRGFSGTFSVIIMLDFDVDNGSVSCIWDVAIFIIVFGYTGIGSTKVVYFQLNNMFAMTYICVMLSFNRIFRPKTLSSLCNNINRHFKVAR